MTTDEIKIKDAILKAVHSKLCFPTEVKQAMDDERTMCVYVYNVPEEEIESVEDIIFDIEDNEFEGSEYSLMPMVKDDKTTAEFYTQFARCICKPLIDSVVSLYGNYFPSWSPLLPQNGDEAPQLALAAADEDSQLALAA